MAVPANRAIMWAGADSNHRRRRRLIYSQLPLSTRAPAHIVPCVLPTACSTPAVGRADDRTRTDNLLFTRQLLCRLSYVGKSRKSDAAYTAQRTHALCEYSTIAILGQIRREMAATNAHSNALLTLQYLYGTFVIAAFDPIHALRTTPPTALVYSIAASLDGAGSPDRTVLQCAKIDTHPLAEWWSGPHRLADHPQRRSAPNCLPTPALTA